MIRTGQLWLFLSNHADDGRPFVPKDPKMYSGGMSSIFGAECWCCRSTLQSTIQSLDVAKS
jgi:hypothetical protein